MDVGIISAIDPKYVRLDEKGTKNEQLGESPKSLGYNLTSAVTCYREKIKRISFFKIFQL